MPKRILVPLDRSMPAENILAFIVDTARAGAVVRLLHVVPIRRDSELLEDGADAGRFEAEATAYLRAVAEAHLYGLAVDWAVRFGPPAEQILAEADAFDADVIVVATTVRSSMARGLLGSVAEEIVRSAPVTVLLVRPPL